MCRGGRVPVVLAVFRCAGRCAAVAPVSGRRLYARQGRPVRSVKKANILSRANRLLAPITFTRT